MSRNATRGTKGTLGERRAIGKGEGGGETPRKTSREKGEGDNRAKIEIQPMLDVGGGRASEGEGEVQLVATSSNRANGVQSAAHTRAGIPLSANRIG